MITVFFVDDMIGQAEMMSDYISENHDVKVHIFRSGEECLKNLELLNPQIIFLDYNFDLAGEGAMTGIEILKQIKARRPKTEVVMITGNDSLKVAIDCKEHGAFDYIVKGQTSFHRAENAFLNIRRLLEMEERLKSGAVS